MTEQDAELVRLLRETVGAPGFMTGMKYVVAGRNDLRDAAARIEALSAELDAAEAAIDEAAELIYSEYGGHDPGGAWERIHAAAIKRAMRGKA